MKYMSLEHLLVLWEVAVFSTLLWGNTIYLSCSTISVLALCNKVPSPATDRNFSELLATIVWFKSAVRRIFQLMFEKGTRSLPLIYLYLQQRHIVGDSRILFYSYEPLPESTNLLSRERTSWWLSSVVIFLSLFSFQKARVPFWDRAVKCVCCFL